MQTSHTACLQGALEGSFLQGLKWTLSAMGVTHLLVWNFGGACLVGSGANWEAAGTGGSAEDGQ